MTIRWKLNVAFIALVGLFLVSAAVTVRTIAVTANQTRSYVRTRELAQYTAAVRTLIYAWIAAGADPQRLPPESTEADWAMTTLDDIDINIRLAHGERERQSWRGVRAALVELDDALGSDAAPARTASIVRRAEQHLLDLHNLYDLTQTDAIVSIARSSFYAQIATGVACLLTVLLFLAHMILIRRWLIRPVGVIKSSVETIGRGDLAHRVPLAGRDELGVLARGIDDMAAGLATRQAELVRAREFSAIGEMCANIAHGLRNPLAAIRTSAQLAARRANGSAVVRESFDAIAHQADLMDQRIRRLFQFSCAIDLRPRPTQVGRLLADAATRAGQTLTTDEVQIVIEDRTGGRSWPLDQERVAEALAELAVNAAHHSTPGSVVTLCGAIDDTPGSAGGPTLRIEVIDRGAGMPAATCAKAFDPFFTTRSGGTGMGLTLVRRLVEGHGGEISIASLPGQGTTVSLTFGERSAVAGRPPVDGCDARV